MIFTQYRSALTWRVALIITVAVAVLGAVTMLVAYRVVEGQMYRNLRASLNEEVETLARVYTVGGVAGNPFIGGPNAGVVLQIYSHNGLLIIASRTEFEREDAMIPQEIVLEAFDKTVHWQGNLLDRQFEVALASFNLGVVALVADTTYISDVLVALSRGMLIGTAIIVLLGIFTGYFVAGASLRPLRRLARRAAQLDEQRLEQLPYANRSDEIGSLSHAMNDLLARLREVLENQRLFLVETSHELRTPLTALQGFLGRAHRKTQDEDVAIEIRNAQRVAWSMARLVEDLLQLSRGRLVAEALSNLVDVNQEVLIPVAKEFPGVQVPECVDEVPVLGDPERLKQLLRNLVTNAVRAAGNAKGVEIQLALADEIVVISVRDEGPGIPRELQEVLFDKFIKGQTGGSGLGLAIAKQIAEHHQGTIRVESEPGNTVFTVQLPLLQVDSDDD